MKINFNEFIMTKNQYGEYSSIRTLMGGGFLLGEFNRLLRTQNVFDKKASVNRIVSSMMTLLSDKEVDEIKNCFYSAVELNKWGRSKEPDNIPMIVMSSLLGIIYRQAKLILSSNGINIPETVDLNSKEQLVYSMVLDAEGILPMPVCKLVVTDKVKETIIFGKSDRKVLNNVVRQHITVALISMFEFARNKDVKEVTDNLIATEKKLKDKETAVNNLKKKNDKLIVQAQKAKEVNTKTVVEVKEVDTYKPLYEDAMAENFELEKKIFNLQARLNEIEMATANNDELEQNIILAREERKEKAKSYDLSEYNIVVLADRKRYKSDDYKVVDLIASPKSTIALDGADIVVMLTGFINHSAYYSAKSYCKAHGIKSVHCDIRTNNIEKVDDAIKQSVIDFLI